MKNILLIDDEALTNMINTKIISIVSSHNILDFTRARKALQQINSWLLSPDELPDIIFLDINMPDMDGWEFLDEFENLPDIVLNKCRLYILTSSIDHDDIEKSKTYKSVSGFISKPLVIDKLTSLLAS